jgi:hypothetical protein
MTSKTERIRALNDRLRTTGQGGQIVVTRGVAALGTAAVAEIMAAVQVFDSFTPDNDPNGEHDFAALDAAGQRVMFKIDYFDANLCAHSPDPSDAAATKRVLTIMLASEY